MRLAVLALLGLLATTALATPVHAVSEPPWFRTDTVSSPHRFLSEPLVAVAPTGTVLAAWTWQDGGRLGANSAARTTGPGFDRERALPAGRVAGPLLAGSPSRAVVALLRPAGSNRHPRSSLRVAFGTPAGAFGPARLVVRRPRIARPALAGNARGDLALAWFEDRGARTDRVAVALRRRGRAFGRPSTLATGRIRNVAVAVGPAGHVLVAWEARGIVRARSKAPGAARFGRAETVRSEPAFFTDLHAGVARSGRAYLAWSAQRRTEGGEAGPVLVQAASRAPGRRFGRAQLLERLAAGAPQHPVDLDVDSRGHALLGWTGDRPKLAEAGAAGGFAPTALPPEGATPNLRPPEGVLADVVCGTRGRRLVLWTDEGRIQAAYDRGAGFEPPEIVAGRGSTPRGAMGARSNPVVAYVADDRVQVASRRG